MRCPPYDPELKVVLDRFPPSPPNRWNLSFLPALRANSISGLETLPNDPTISHTERTIPGPDGELVMSIVRLKEPASARPKPVIYAIHGGGMITGTRFRGLVNVYRYAKDCDAVIFSLEYRLAPEHPDPAPVEDCYAGLMWIASNAAELGIDPAKILILGGSSGSGIAAGVCLLARDRKGPAIMAQCLPCPMLDDRVDSVSNQQYTEGQPWTRDASIFGWQCLLGERRGGDDVSIYAAPARAKDLTDLPPAFIDVGSADVMRDEAVAYASKLWEAGVQTELHVWPGGFHGYEVFAADSALSKAARATRAAWMVKMLSS